jgi:uncharacterized protein with NAD-binding domain and iron-sulfur cluster
MNATTSASSQKRVVIIGGGVGALTTALELSATDELRARYKLRVYQEGWRLGGKGASGRNADIAQRIEEHGLHIWSGFYVNAFRLMRSVYEEAKRPRACPLSTFDDAFKPHNNVSWQEFFDNEWQPWTVDMRERKGDAGNPPGPIPQPICLLLRMVPWAFRFLGGVIKEVEKSTSKKRASMCVASDIKNPASFAKKLREKPDKVSAFLSRRFSPATLQNPKRLRGALVKELNKMIRDQPHYEAQRFDGIRLSPETQQLQAQNPRGGDVAQLNRSILEDVYPEELEKKPKDQQPTVPDRIAEAPRLIWTLMSFAFLYVTNHFANVVAGSPGALSDSSTFLADDLKDGASLARNLKDSPNELSSYLRSRLREYTRQGLAKWHSTEELPPALEESLIQDLNAIIEGSSIWDESRFTHVQIRRETKKLLKGKPSGLKLIHLNRLLLEDAYPVELSRKPLSREPRTSQPNSPPLSVGSSHCAPRQVKNRRESWLLTIRKNIINRVRQEPKILRLFILLDAAICIARGILFGGVLWRGFDCLDREDFVEWLLRQGAIPEITVCSGMVRGTYDYIFAYPGGDTGKPALAAGVALRLILRLLLTYQHSVFYRMQAGMGDAVFAPIYQVLKKRGVKFYFFHRVETLGFSKDQKSIATIQVRQEVRLRDGREPWNYSPLVCIRNLPCWPNQPRFEQIDPLHADHLRTAMNTPGEAAAGNPQRRSVESRGQGQGQTRTIILEAGKDDDETGFDLVVLGASLAALPSLFTPGGVSEKMQRMFDHVQTVPTLAMQLWLGKDARELGWRNGETIMTGYAQPFDTWADMTHLVHRECWPPNATPRNISYFCGPLRENQVPRQRSSRQSQSARGDEQNVRPARSPPEPDVRVLAFDWLNQYAQGLWHASTVACQPFRFNARLLLDSRPENRLSGFEEQYFRANVAPTDRYVISVPGSTEFRLRADESGYENLFFAGDWLRTGLNYGCVEGAVMGGMQAARAISKSQIKIYGETDFCRAR